MDRLGLPALTDRMTTNTQEKRTPLVLGGTGKTGRRVVERLSARGVPRRIGSRSGEPPFDWENAATWGDVLRGVTSVYVTYQPDLAFPGAAERVSAFADRAVSSGVRRLVLLSGRNEDGALAGERAVQSSGAEWTVVRSSFFNQDFSEAFLLEPLLSGELAFPAGDTAEAFIDADDVADVVVAALTEDQHVGQVYEVTGPRLLTFAEAVDEIAAATGRDLRYVPVSAEDFASAMREAGLPDDEVRAYTDLFTTVLDGRSAYLGDGVQRSLGREPRDFRDYVRDVAAAGVWNTPRVAAVGR
jgi:uncharacterized protein YbjT (DUF2867 family)